MALDDPLGKPPQPKDEDLAQLGEVRPTLKNPQTGNTAQPPVVTSVRGTLPLDTNTTQGTGGRTFVNTNGDMNVRMVLEGYLFRSDLKQLTSLIRTVDEVKVITEGYVGRVNFDQFKWSREEGEQRGSYTFQGKTVTEPLYTFQLQSKENDNDDGGIF